MQLGQLIKGAMLTWPLFFSLTSSIGLCTGDFPPNDEATLNKVADSRYWHLLLHYKRSITLATKGEAETASFYFSPQGHSSPYRELVASIEAFQKNTGEIGPLKQHPQCAFPERYRYLKETLHLEVTSEVCKPFLEWKSRFNPRSVTLVFATAYLNNSATMFGHTFLRVDSRPRPDHLVKNDLLDYGLNFGAGMVPGGGTVNAVLGLTGGLPGFFSMMPYFDKVHEYSDTESRDLWEYQLSLNAEQISRMLNHTWELASTSFPYYFFDKNCSYQLLALLEVANPDWHLTDQFFYWVIPSDTVRALKKIDGAIVDAHMRPSLYRQLKQRLEALNIQEQGDFKRSAGATLALNGKESALVLDTLIESHEYNFMKAQKQPDDAYKERKRQLLLARARLDAQAPEFPPIIATNRPDLGLSSEKFSAYGGSKTGGDSYTGLQLRPGFHDLLDLDAGYLDFSEVALFRTDLRYYANARQFRVHEFEAVELTSLPPVDGINHGISWMTVDGLYSPPDLDCKHCVAARVSAGAGYSVSPLPASDGLVVSALLKGNVEYSGWFKGNFRMGPSFQTQALADVSTFAKAGVSGELYYYPTQNALQRTYERFTGQFAFNPLMAVTTNIELRFTASYYFLSRGNSVDATGMLSFYF